jgi:hypothetical protein
VFRTEAAECLEAIEAGLLDLTHKLDDKMSSMPFSAAFIR